MTASGLADHVRRVFPIAVVAALVAGTITGTQLTIEDDAWPRRGGLEAVLQISLLFTGYALAVTLPVGLLMGAALDRPMASSGPFAHAAVGAAIGCAVHLLVFLAIRERIDGSEDFIGGTIAGAVAGLLWWKLARREQRKAVAHG
jgi:hypothetical protein